METKKTIQKYAIILLIYVVIYYAIQPYIVIAYAQYLLSSAAHSAPFDTTKITGFTTLANIVLRIIIALMVAVDTKFEQSLDWLIIVIILVHAETGILLFLLWQMYKQVNANPTVLK